MAYLQRYNTIEEFNVYTKGPQYHLSLMHKMVYQSDEKNSQFNCNYCTIVIMKQLWDNQHSHTVLFISANMFNCCSL